MIMKFSKFSDSHLGKIQMARNGEHYTSKLESTLKIDQNLSTLNFGCTEEEKCLPAASGLSLTSRVSKGEIMKIWVAYLNV